VYCRDYSRSDFCQWELQLAIIRDPIGKDRIVIPIMIEPVDLPPYCALTQAAAATGGDFDTTVLHVLKGIWP